MPWAGLPPPQAVALSRQVRIFVLDAGLRTHLSLSSTSSILFSLSITVCARTDTFRFLFFFSCYWPSLSILDSVSSNSSIPFPPPPLNLSIFSILHCHCADRSLCSLARSGTSLHRRQTPEDRHRPLSCSRDCPPREHCCARTRSSSACALL